MLAAFVHPYSAFRSISGRFAAAGCRAVFFLAWACFAAAQPAAEAPETARAGGVTETELRQLLAGKALYLRGGYQDNTLSFDEHGHLMGSSPQGSYTLSAVEINKVRLGRHKVMLEGVRYGLHFTAQTAYEDPAKAFDRVRITPRKKVVKITVVREVVVRPRKVKHKKKAKAEAMPADGPEERGGDGQFQAAATPVDEHPAGSKSVTITTSPAQAAQALREALENIFAQGFDERMMAAMPDFWRLYYQAVAERADYRPKDPAILRQNMVDRKASLLTSFEPESNEFAQTNGVVGMALYHTVVGADGKAGEIAVGRPIGFGLDENAVTAIRKAQFAPALKDGKPVPVLLDLVVQFRIFSKRTDVHGEPEPDKLAEPVLPGPYSAPHS